MPSYILLLVLHYSLELCSNIPREIPILTPRPCAREIPAINSGRASSKTPFMTPDDVLSSLSLLEKPPAKREKGMAIAKVNYSHQDMADFILMNPTITQNEIAARYGHTPSWVSQIINSDAFQAYLSARRAELVDPTLVLTIEERMRGVTARSLQVIQDKLSAPSELVSDELALRAAALGAKSLGMGIAPPAPPPPSSNLADLAERLVSLARRPSQGVIDVESRTVPSDPGVSGAAA